MNSKKAMSGVSILAIVIISLAVLLGLGVFSGTIAGIITKAGDIETCRLSVLAQAQTKFLGESVINLECPRRQVTIFEDKVEVNKKKDRNYKFKELSNDAVNKVIAEELRLCWYKMGQGYVDVFEQSLLGSDFTCTICAEIKFDGKIEREEKFTGLNDYLKSYNIPKNNIKYYDYLSGLKDFNYDSFGYTFYFAWTYPDEPIDVNKVYFDKDKQYIIYFLAFKPSFIDEIEIDSAYSVGVGTPDKLIERCETLMN